MIVIAGEDLEVGDIIYMKDRKVYKVIPNEAPQMLIVH